MTRKRWPVQQATVFLVVTCPIPTPSPHPTPVIAQGSSSPYTPPSLALLTSYLQRPPAMPYLCICVAKRTGGACGQASLGCRSIASTTLEHSAGSVKSVQLKYLCCTGFPAAGTVLRLDKCLLWEEGRICGGRSGVFGRNKPYSSTTRLLLTGLPIPGGNPGASAFREKPPLSSFPRRLGGGGTSLGFLEDLDTWTLAGTRSLGTPGQSFARSPSPFPLLPPGGLNPRQLTSSHRCRSRLGAPCHPQVH